MKRHTFLKFLLLAQHVVSIKKIALVQQNIYFTGKILALLVQDLEGKTEIGTKYLFYQFLLYSDHCPVSQI